MWACLSLFYTWFKTPFPLTCQHLNWAVRRYYSISCLTWGQQSKEKDITNWCHTSINRDILFFTKLIQSSSVNSFFPRKDRSKKAATNDWVRPVFDTSMCEYKADHKGGDQPLELTQYPLQEPHSDVHWAELQIPAYSHIQVQWKRTGSPAPQCPSPPNRFSLLNVTILTCLNESDWLLCIVRFVVLEKALS